MTKERSKLCLVIGAGDGLGGAIARAFAAQGLTVCITRRPRNLERLEILAQSIRDQGGQAHAFGIDAREEAPMVDLINTIEAEIGDLDVVAFNIGANVKYSITETSSRVYQKVWEMAAFAGFVAAREAARVMLPRGRGTIIFTGATASLRGREGFSAFSGAKHALRALAQSQARELGPRGLHIAHIILDGMVEGTFIKGLLPDYEARLAAGDLIQVDEAAKNWVWLWKQNKSAWTHELDLRPSSETW
ncbi:SDR family NAD(P)-dependent oxidoreductase [Candidatus Phycosocius spiralis]|uniref:Short-chain dehydrogenase n=1 Tax=Candidatus Phycosocius spiralis TaxID=2815099 RepID=A0ABQ4PSS2_9PROT|nr:SDR family NAD(P)-dependent oxidoreductase [Candidatus Phycosocius spiralis]GIU66055.1 short-chain dehydrogenase [Candidatus Phycosocius spiralis]